jgi:CBS domain-containing protein
MIVRSILEGKGETVLTVTPSTGVADAARILSGKRIGAVVVTDPQGTIAGILSERDIVRGLANHGERVMAMEVRELMTSNVQVCAMDDTVDRLMDVMTQRRIRHLPVVSGDRLVGIVTIGDVVKWKLDETVQEADSLREYIKQAG